MVKIVQKDGAVLRKTAKPLVQNEITSAATKRIIKDMQAAMATREDAVAIAAPQIGHSIRLFIVSSKVFKDEKHSEPKDLICINPEITKTSRKKAVADEGCLSVDGWYGKTKRAEKVTLVAFNEKGEQFTRGATGLLAQIFQHEVDHLNGKLFIDHAIETWEIAREDKNKKENEKE